MRSPSVAMPALILASTALFAGCKPPVVSAGKGLKTTMTGHFMQSSYQATLTDPSHDDFGPGAYTYPLGKHFPAGIFDVTRLQIHREGDELILSAHFRARPRMLKNLRLDREGTLDMFWQTIDIYIDTDGIEGSGITRSLPGRRFSFDSRSAWEKVLLISPRPHIFKSQLLLVDRKLARRVVAPRRVRLKGRKLTAHFSLEETGTPNERWGYVVTVAGTSPRASFRIADLIRSRRSAGGFIIPVEAKAAPCSPGSGELYGCAFGGCNPCGNHPQVIDVIAHKRDQLDDQQAMLSGYTEKRQALLTAIYPHQRYLGERTPAARRNGGMAGPIRRLRARSVSAGRRAASDREEGNLKGVVTDYAQGTVSVSIDGGKPFRGQIATIRNDKGKVLGTFAVQVIIGKLVVGPMIETKGEIIRGLPVGFSKRR